MRTPDRSLGMTRYLAGLVQVLSFVFFALTFLGIFVYTGLWLNSLLFSAGKWSAAPNAEYFIRVNMHGTIVHLSHADELLYYSSLSYCGFAIMALGIAGNLLKWCADRLVGDRPSERREAADTEPMTSDRLVKLWETCIEISDLSERLARTCRSRKAVAR